MRQRGIIGIGRETMDIGDTVRIKPFTNHFGKIVDLRPEDLRSVAVQSSTYGKGRVVWLRPQDVDPS